MKRKSDETEVDTDGVYVASIAASSMRQVQKTFMLPSFRPSGIELFEMRLSNWLDQKPANLPLLFDLDFTLRDLKNSICNIKHLKYVLTLPSLNPQMRHYLFNYLISALPVPTNGLSTHPCDDEFLLRCIPNTESFDELVSMMPDTVSRILSIHLYQRVTSYSNFFQLMTRQTNILESGLNKNPSPDNNLLTMIAFINDQSLNTNDKSSGGKKYLEQLFNDNFSIIDLKIIIKDIKDLALLLDKLIVTSQSKINRYNLVSMLISSFPIATDIKYWCATGCDDLFLSKIIKCKKDLNTLTKKLVSSCDSKDYSNSLFQRITLKSDYIKKILHIENEKLENRNSSNHTRGTNKPVNSSPTFFSQSQSGSDIPRRPVKRRKIDLVEMEIYSGKCDAKSIISENNSIPGFHALISTEFRFFGSNMPITREKLEQLFDEENVDVDSATISSA